jgi:hypothetical protein
MKIRVVLLLSLLSLISLSADCTSHKDSPKAHDEDDDHVGVLYGPGEDDDEEAGAVHEGPDRKIPLKRLALSPHLPPLAQVLPLTPLSEPRWRKEAFVGHSNMVVPLAVRTRSLKTYCLRSC